MTNKQALKAMEKGEIDMKDMKLGKDKPQPKKADSKLVTDIKNNWETIKYVSDSAFWIVLGLTLTATSVFSFMYGASTVGYKPLGTFVRFSGALVIFLALYSFGKGLKRR